MVEANLSCPNVQKREGEAYRDPELASAQSPRRCGAVPAISAAADESRRPRGSGRNASATAGGRRHDGRRHHDERAQPPVVDPSGAASFGENRQRAGITGGAIYRFALRQVREAVAITEHDRLSIKVVGCGGITTPQRARSILDAGAYAALAATAVVWNPYLAIEVKRADPSI